AEDGIRDRNVTGVQTCALPICRLGVRETGEEEEREEIAARLRASEAALARLEELASEPWMHQGALSHTRDRYRLRTRHLRGHAEGVLENPSGAQAIAQLMARHGAAQLRMPQSATCVRGRGVT